MGFCHREKRPGFDRQLKDATARKIDIVAAWSVDRLGRSLQDLVSFLMNLSALSCDLYLPLILTVPDLRSPPVAGSIRSFARAVVDFFGPTVSIATFYDRLSFR
jgi:Resolvase, N terminal domain